VHGAQRFAPTELYDSLIAELVKKIRAEGRQRAELQALFIGDHALAAVPAEYFVEFGLDIKEKTWPTHTFVVSCANGMVGYLPTREAFRRGGYETTFYDGTCTARGAGEKVTSAMIRLVKKGAA
jgi:neutral ceramidase